MDQENSLASLRSRVSVLLEQEAALLSQAMECSRAKDRQAVDALFARVQAIQVERSSLAKQIATLVGTQRMHVAAEVWKPGTYGYREDVGTDSVRVSVVQGPLGLQVILPGRGDAVGIETLKGTFHGPLPASGGVP
jgi:hypothetical protein